MAYRLLGFLLIISVVGGACGPRSMPVDDIPVIDASANVPPPITRTLMFVPSGPLQLQPGQRVELTALLSDDRGPVDDEVRFALVGSALDASLSVTRVRAINGRATTTLIAPTDAATLRIRANAVGAADAYVEAGVSARGFGGVDVTARYRGVRGPSLLRVQLFDAASCEAIAQLEPLRTTTVPPTGGSVVFSGLAAGQSFVVLGEAIGPTATVARDCIAPIVIVRDQQVSATLSYVDLPLHLDGAYELSLDLDLGELPQSAATSWLTAARAPIAASGTEARFLLAAFASAVEASAGRDARIAFERADLEGVLTNDITRRAASPLDALQRLASDATAMLRGIDVRALLIAADRMPGVMGVRVASARAIVDPLTPDVQRDDLQFDLPITPTSSSGEGVVRDGDRISLSIRTFPLAFSTASRRAIDAWLARAGVSSTAELLRLTMRCAEMTPLVLPYSSMCTESCLLSACERAVAELSRTFDLAVDSYGVSLRSIDFSFEAAAQGRSGTLMIERTDPSAMMGRYAEDGSVTLRGVASLASQ